MVMLPVVSFLLVPLSDLLMVSFFLPPVSDGEVITFDEIALATQMRCVCT